MSNDLSTTVNRYIEAWNEPDDERRRELVASVWTDAGTYVDPMLSGEGHDGIATMIGGAQAQFPGHRFELAFGPDAHHDYVRFAWHLFGPDGNEPVAAGVDFATVENGRFAAVIGFLEGGPA